MTASTCSRTFGGAGRRRGERLSLRLDHFTRDRARVEALRRADAGDPGRRRQRHLLRHAPLFEQSYGRGGYALAELRRPVGSHPGRLVAQREVRPSHEQLGDVRVGVEARRKVDRGQILVVKGGAHAFFDEGLGARGRNRLTPVKRAQV